MPLPADPSPELQSYAHPERLVTADWLASHLGAPGLAVVESDEDVLLYDVGHIPGAVKIDWHTDLNDPHVRDYINGEQFAALMDAKGIARDDTVVIYGDKSNWWAAYALWVFTLFGHPDVRLLDGGRDLWISSGRETTLEVPDRRSSGYPVVQRNDAPIRAFKEDVLANPRQATADRRALSAGVHRRAHAHAGLPRRGRAARRPHPHRGVDPVGQGGRRQRAVPQARRTRGAVRVHRARRQDHRVLPHRRTLQPHLVRADTSARPARCAQLRRLLDGVGQHRARPDRGRRGSPARHDAPDAAGRGGVRLPGGRRPGQAQAAAGVRRRTAAAAAPTSKKPRWSRCPNASRRLFLHVDAADRGDVRLFFSAPAEAPTTRGFASILATASTISPPTTSWRCPTTSTPTWAWRR